MNKIILTLAISLASNIAMAQTVPFPGLGAQFTNASALPANLLPSNVKLIGSTTPTTNTATDAKEDADDEAVENTPVATPAIQSNGGLISKTTPKPAATNQTTTAQPVATEEAVAPVVIEENRRLDYNHYSEKYNTNLGSKNTDMSYKIFLMNMYYSR